MMKKSIEIMTTSFGRGLGALKKINAGHVLITVIGRRILERTRLSIQIAANDFVLVGEPLELVNHSCQPNAGLNINEKNFEISLYAIKNISAKEEITIDYSSFEAKIDFMPPECKCKSFSCRKAIVGYEDLDEIKKLGIEAYTAPYLLRR